MATLTEKRASLKEMEDRRKEWLASIPAGEDFEKSSIPGETNQEKGAAMGVLLKDIASLKADIELVELAQREREDSKDMEGNTGKGNSADIQKALGYQSGPDIYTPDFSKYSFGEICAAIKREKAGSNGQHTFTMDFNDLNTFKDTFVGAVPLRRDDDIVTNLRRELNELDVITTVPFDRDTYIYQQVTGRVNSAAPTSRGAATPEGTLTVTRNTAFMRTIRVILPIAKEVLMDDARYAMEIDEQLQFDVREELGRRAWQDSGTERTTDSGDALSGVEASLTGNQTVAAVATDIAHRLLVLKAKELRKNGAYPHAVICDEDAWGKIWDDLMDLHVPYGGMDDGMIYVFPPSRIPIVVTGAASANVVTMISPNSHWLVNRMDIMVDVSEDANFENYETTFRAVCRANVAARRPEAAFKWTAFNLPAAKYTRTT